MLTEFAKVCSCSFMIFRYSKEISRKVAKKRKDAKDFLKFMTPFAPPRFFAALREKT